MTDAAPMMTLRVGPDAVEFLAGDRLAGRYRFGDPFKPYLHPLNTPAGETLSLASPHDHKHHKGLMYALRVRDVNFWEEVATLPGEVPGCQRHERFVSLNESGDAVGFEEELTWLALDGDLITFGERRSLSCRALPGDGGFEWTWATELEARRDLELTMSQWSASTDAGMLVNYHGLGVRFRREFGCTGGNALLLDGAETPFRDGMGAIATEVAFHGSIDGGVPPRRAGLAVRQAQANALFALDMPFAFIGLGPTNLAPRRLAAGERLSERYVVTVFDLPSGPTRPAGIDGGHASEPRP